MEKNKTGKYLKYAIGEIVLVMVGILLALSINNWNEERKVNDKETALLKQMDKSIDSDLFIFKNIYYNRLNNKRSGIDSLVYYSAHNLTLSESKLVEFFNQSQTDIVVSYNSAAFDDLKSTGFEVVKNDSLRASIIQLYQSLLPLFKGFTEKAPIEYNPRIHEIKRKIFGKRIYQNSNNENIFTLHLKIDNALNHPDFIELLSLENDKYHNYINRLRFMENRLIALRTDIQKELNNRTNNKIPKG